MDIESQEHIKVEESDHKENSSLEQEENGESSSYPLGTLSALTSPLNLSPRPSESEGEKKIPKALPLLNKVSPRVSPTSSNFHCPTPPNSWTRLCSTPYFFPPFQLPFIYPLPESPTPTTPATLIPRSEDHRLTTPALSPRTSKEDENSNQDKAPNGDSRSPLSDKDERGSPHHYQVKWSNHASRLTSFIASLEGDAASSDTIISASDGSNFYTHRLVLASSSPFFRRTLKNITKEEHAVIVIPRAPSRCISAIISFCYRGKIVLPKDDLCLVMELAEDLEITGLLIEKEKQGTNFFHSQTRPSSTFPFPNSPLNLGSGSPYPNWSKRSSSPLYNSSIGSHSAGPFSGPTWKREVINYSPTAALKRIKSESDAYKGPVKKTLKVRHSETNMKIEANSSVDITNSLMPYQRHSTSTESITSLTNSMFDEQQAVVGIIPRHAGTGSRVLLWKFLLQLLHDDRYSPYYIRWLERPQGVFRIMESDKVAQLWGMARKNKNMTYEKMSRGMRTYYKRSILYHLDGTKLIYRFNIQEPEIQQQLRYYNMLSQKPDEESHSYEAGNSSPQTSEYQSAWRLRTKAWLPSNEYQNARMLKSEGGDDTPSSCGTPSYAGTPNDPLSPHFMADLPKTAYNFPNLFPPGTTSEETSNLD